MTCNYNKKKDFPIIDPHSIGDTINNNTILIETTENNVVDNGVMEVEDLKGTGSTNKGFISGASSTSIIQI
jgi:hypothetical protein